MANFSEKSRIAYDKIADCYDDTPEGKFTRRHKSLLLSNIILQDGMHVLDVACGNGTLLADMKKQKDIIGYGVDVSEQMIKNAVRNNPGMEFHVSGCEALPFPSGSMDVITVSAAYHHFPDVAAFAKEAKRVLKPGGEIYISEVYFNALLRLLCNPFVPLSKSGDVKFYSPGEIANNFTRFGFEEICVKISGQVQIIQMRLPK